VISQILARIGHPLITVFSESLSDDHSGGARCHPIKSNHGTGPDQINYLALVFAGVRSMPYTLIFSRHQTDRSTLECYSRSCPGVCTLHGRCRRCDLIISFCPDIRLYVFPFSSASLRIGIDDHTGVALPMRFRGANTHGIDVMAAADVCRLAVTLTRSCTSSPSD
jgi:hypothetical protein